LCPFGGGRDIYNFLKKRNIKKENKKILKILLTQPHFETLYQSLPSTLILLPCTCKVRRYGICNPWIVRPIFVHEY